MTLTGSLIRHRPPHGQAIQSSVYRQLIIADGSSGYWRLGESVGSPTAMAVVGPAGSYANMGTLGVSGALNADTDTAATFNGNLTTGSAVTVASFGNFPALAAFSVEAWVNPNNLVDNVGWVFESLDGSGNGYLLRFNTTGCTFQRSATGGTVLATYATPLVVGGWSHLVGTYDGASVRLYVNGTLVAGPIADTHSMAAAAVNLIIGGGPANTVDGTIDEPAVYPLALTAAQVANHYGVGGNTSGQPGQSAYATAVISEGSVQAYWRLNEAVGAATAATEVGSVTGTYPVAPNTPTLGQTGAIAGDANTCASFDGDIGGTNGDYVEFGTGNYTFSGTAAFSLEAWVNPTIADASARRIIGKRSGVNGGWYLQATGTTVTFGRIDSGLVEDTVTYANALSLNNWTHLVATYDGVTMKVYVNGVAGTGVASSRSLAVTTVPFRVGNQSGGLAGTWGGRIDEVAVYNAALSAARISAHYSLSGQTPPAGGTIVFRGDFVDGTTSQWSATQCANYAYTPPSGYTAAPITIVTSPVPAGHTHCAKIDLPVASGGNTCEVVKTRTLNTGTHDYYGFTFMLPANWIEPSVAGWGCALSQMNYEDIWGSPISIRAHVNYVRVVIMSGACAFTTGCPPATTIEKDAIPAARFALSVWHQLITHVYWASDTTGVVETWHKTEGDPTWVKTTTTTGIPTEQWNSGGSPLPASYPTHDSEGAYRGGSATALTIYTGGFVLGDSFAIVANEFL